jgi:hypothetical protein
MALIAACVDDLFFAAKVKETLTSAGHEVVLLTRGQAPPEQAEALVVDLHDPRARELARSAGLPALGFYSHVDAEAKRRGEEAGFAVVVPRSRMARELPALVEQLLEP